MKLQALFTFLIPVVLLFTSLNQSLEPRLEKKMDQLIKKTWKNQPVERVPFLIPPYVKPEESTEVFKLVEENQLIGYMVLNKAYSCRVGGCASWSADSDQSNYDPFFYVVIINTDLTVHSIKVIEYYSEYGYEITNKRWLAQFSGKTGCNATYQKNIDGITGATISGKSMVKDINLTCEMMEKLKQMNII